MKRLGFTGTRAGMSEWQKKRLRAFLRHHRPSEFYHGDCTGADAQAHKIVRETLPDCRIVIHPGDIPKWRAGCKGDVIHDPMPPLKRNCVIVTEADELIAAPEQDTEQARGGTWFTIREGLRKGMPVEILEREQPR